ncbi:MAG: hypothetical protein Q8K75_07625 [Chlamydiales bacterium]|nr:hypothetical protein [Chlamydiales bacterium]
MANTILGNIYSGGAGLFNWGSRLGKDNCFSIGQEKLDPSSVAYAVKNCPLNCLPLVSAKNLNFPGSQSFMGIGAMQEIISLAICSINRPLYDKISLEDIVTVRELVHRVANESSWPMELRAFIIHSLLAYIIPYRSELVLKKNMVFTLPVWVNGKYCLKPCRFDRTVDICGGVVTRIFVPEDGYGSPTYLFHGTICWNMGSGMGVTLADDFNPLGIGEEIRQGARETLYAMLREDKKKYGVAAIAIGHSLGGLVSTSLGIDLPDLISKVISFAPPRASYSLRKQWRALQESGKSCPSISTFIGRFSAWTDPITNLGDVWIGKLFEIHDSKKGFIESHVFPLGRSLDFSIHEIDVEGVNNAWWRRTRVWWLAQRVVAAMVYCVLQPMLILKRTLVGWNAGGAWKYGVLGLPFRLFGKTK